MLLEAVLENDVQRTARLIQQGASPNITDQNKDTLLHIAVSTGSSEMLQYLLTLGDGLVNRTNYCGRTPLFLAIIQRSLKLVKELIEAGANVNVADFEGNTPLHKAAHSPKIAHVLIKNGADLNAQNHYGETPLHASICDNYSFVNGSICSEVMCMLLCYGADANIATLNGLTPFVVAMCRGRFDLQEILFDYVLDVNSFHPNGASLLSWSFALNSPLLGRLIDAGATFSYKDRAVHGVRATVERITFQALREVSLETFQIIWPHFDLMGHYTSMIELLLHLFSDERFFTLLRVAIDINGLGLIFQNF
ncbi:serine/threonine-protein phosphatase 6 regulatory ankyrin repeat subunit C-like [Dendroctonus ponderosae]|uniref:serine/threonine-protein phosphatase 6 regulatory ankyrin repeat subunit C-like n=1 Tax=Dendroctonus ponderosae TaxID=77166 RepID=UPI002035DC54|nr:serine/threonine-protein phosphatase 6 regulatory ankyrin repeat subunit C-like [Dendroctonus ponderosae]